jgi:hypothetical protein
VVAHVGAGHYAWLACALLPFWIEAMLLLSSTPGHSRRVEVAAGAVLFRDVSQGAIHIALISAGCSCSPPHSLRRCEGRH